MSSESQKERRKKTEIKRGIITEIMVESFLNLPRHIKQICQETFEQTANQTNPKKCAPRHVTAKLLKAENMGENLETSQTKTEAKQSEGQISHQEPWVPKGLGKIFFQWWKNRTVNPEIYVQKRYPSEIKEESRYSQMKEN